MLYVRRDPNPALAVLPAFLILFCFAFSLFRFLFCFGFSASQLLVLSKISLSFMPSPGTAFFTGDFVDPFSFAFLCRLELALVI